MSSRKFAVFDIDGTIFRWQLFHELFDAFVEDGLIDESVSAAVLEARESWRRRQSDYVSYEHTLVNATHAAIVGVSEGTFNTIADRILQTKGHYTYRYTTSLLHSLKAKGYVIIAISGSHQQLVDRFAKMHHVDIAVGREYTIDKGLLTEKSSEVFGKKDKILKKLVQDNDLAWEDSYAVGDSGGDIEMLKLVQNPIAFNPDIQLHDAASTNGWQIVVERKNLAYIMTKGSDGSYILAETISY